MTGNRAREWRWSENHREEREALGRELGVTPILAGLLLARGCADAAAAVEFLNPSFDHLHDPFLLPDAGLAAERIARAIRDGEKILVHGDYDVDGLAAAALMTRTIRTLRGSVECFVPHRQLQGYDLQVETVQRAAADGVRLIVTVDCGIVAFEAAEAARELGVDLVITDHHEPHPERVPPAVAVVNPRRPDSAYPFPHLAGVGVAYKVATALLRCMEVPEASFRKKYLDLVALGTVSDCMPLLGENRVLVKYGLEALAATRRPGLKALMSVADVRQVTARAVGFALGPRLNAAGRMDAAEHGLNLLMCEEPSEAVRLAQWLDQCNRDRQVLQGRILDEAMAQARELDLNRTPILVLAASGWHPGVIGIVASKVVDALGRPTVMIALDGDRGRGSARSVSGFHLLRALDRCRDRMLHLGGHEAAAGFDIDAREVPALREELGRIGAEMISSEMLAPVLLLDDLIDGGSLTLALAKEIHSLEPFGHGNPEPIFGSRGLPLQEIRRWAARAPGTSDHLKLFLGASGTRVEAVFWRQGHLADELGRDVAVDLCYHLEVDTYWGDERLRLNVKELRLA